MHLAIWVAAFRSPEMGRRHCDRHARTESWPMDAFAVSHMYFLRTRASCMQENGPSQVGPHALCHNRTSSRHAIALRQQVKDINT
mmetsp:Transcript_53200/g.119428  ORF Transcript_53200/g.119428 Transcript_53200/m.119428 type:complete len:85 (-) Transcript_53200:642-896(-)